MSIRYDVKDFVVLKRGLSLMADVLFISGEPPMKARRKSILKNDEYHL
jgi:hypothetical protein